MPRALSTSVCRLPADPAGVVQRWRELAGDSVHHLAVDARFPSELQELLLSRCRVESIAVLELAHPTARTGNRRPASPISADSDERRAARLSIEETLRRAERFGIYRVALHPFELALSSGRQELSRAFLRAERLALPGLLAEREHRAARALDGLRLVLDPLLRAADDAGRRLMLAVPPPWPHQCPSPAEAELLLRSYTGAPLGLGYATDWSYQAALLREERHSAAVPNGLWSVRLADASGLRLRLPLGTGEIEWAALLAALPAGLDEVLTLDTETSRQELQQSLELLERSPRSTVASRATPG